MPCLTTTYRARLLPIRRKQKNEHVNFRRSRIVVVSQSNRTHRNFDHFRRSRMRRGIVVS